MPANEIAEVFEGSHQDRDRLESFASGWPAVIGLASQSEYGRVGVELPATLYDFFAEEIYGALKEDVRLALAVFASLPSIDWLTAREILGRSKANRVCRQALELGLLDSRGSSLELHPLAQSFLHRRRAEEGIDELASVLGQCLQFYLSRQNWDAAFDLIERNCLASQFESLLESGLDSLLNEARLASLERWLEFWAGRPPTPIVQIAMAELALRRGEHLQALTLAEHALSLAGARKSRSLRFRALLVAGQAANVGTDEVAALNYFKRAEEIAQTSGQAREAMWGQLMCLSELEESSAIDVLEGLAASNPRDDPRQVVREAGRRLGVEFRFGAFRSIRRAADSNQLLPLVSDPVVRASFRSTYSTALAVCAQYDLATAVARELLADAQDHRLKFVRPYGLATLGIALAGVRDFSEADACLAEALTLSREAGNSHAEFNAFAIQLRSLLQQGRAEEALAIPEPIGEVPGKGMLGEVVAIRALVRACSGRLDDALKILSSARGVTGAIEARVLIPAVEAIVALGKKDREGPALAERMLSEAEDSGALDLVVTAYRGSPQLFTVMMSSARCRERLWPVLVLARDEWLAESIGRGLPQPGDRKSLLSRREREVYELMCEGLTNGQIAACLVISEETVKLHVHHVFDKLGIRSRTALMLEAAQARAQAAPRTESANDDPNSTDEPSKDSTED